MIPGKLFCQRLTERKYVGAVILGLLLVSVAPEWTEAQSAGQPAAVPSDQKIRDLERRIQKLEAKMDQTSKALGRRGHGPDTLFTTVRASRPLDPTVRLLRMDTNIGNIQLTRGDGAEIMVEAIVRLDKRWVELEKTSKEFDEHVRMAQTGDVLTIADAHKDAPDHEAWAVSLKVAIPRALPITALAGIGDVTVEIASGAVWLSTGVGNLTLNADTVESVTGSAGSGNATLHLGTVTGNVEAKAGAGSLTLQADSVASVIGEAGSGNATLHLGTVTGKVEAKAGAGNVALKLRQPGSQPDVHLTSGAGNLVLDLPPGSSGKFDLESGMGSISVEGLQGVQVKKKGMGASASAQVGEEGPHYKLRASVGSITISVRK